MTLEEFDNIVKEHGYKPYRDIHKQIDEEKSYIEDCYYMNSKEECIYMNVDKDNTEEGYTCNQLQVTNVEIQSFISNVSGEKTLNISLPQDGNEYTLLIKCLYIAREPEQQYYFLLERHLELVKFIINDLMPLFKKYSCTLSSIKALLSEEGCYDFDSSEMYLSYDTPNGNYYFYTDVITGDNHISFGGFDLNISKGEFKEELLINRLKQDSKDSKKYKDWYRKDTLRKKRSHEE